MNPAWISILYDAAKDIWELFGSNFNNGEPVEDEVDADYSDGDWIAHIDHRLYQIEEILRKQLSLMEGTTTPQAGIYYGVDD